MARSAYIYVVLVGDWDSVFVAGAFTVKHELISWLKQRKFGLSGLDVWRLKDGPFQDPELQVNVTEQIRKEMKG